MAITKKQSITLLVTLFLSANVLAEINVYYGNLHAHSELSDGKKGVTPRDAYQHARTEGNLDFMSLSEHNELLTKQEMTILQKAADEETKDGFIALYGQEYGKISGIHNHTNIQNYPNVIPGSINEQYRKVFGVMLPAFRKNNPDQIFFAGFNHPHNLSTDYGLSKDYNNNWKKFVADMDPYVQLISVWSGPTDLENIDITLSDKTDLIHRNFNQLREWFEYLSHGMHLAPKVDHDNHSKTYGQRIAGRTAVWVDGELTKKKLLEALAARHVYAVEDINLEIIAKVGVSHLPGDIIKTNSTELKIQVKDEDEPDAKYKLEIFAGISGSGEIANVIHSEPMNNGSTTFKLKRDFEGEKYFIAHIIQESDDPQNTSKINDVWLAPIWLNPP